MPTPPYVKYRNYEGNPVFLYSPEVVSLDGDAPPVADLHHDATSLLTRDAEGSVTDFDLEGLADKATLVQVRDAITALADGGITGTFGYAAGTAAGSVDIPVGAKLNSVSLIPGDTVAGTVSIFGGAAITVLPRGGFDQQLPGAAVATSGAHTVVFGGTIRSYYVDWTTP